MFDKERLRKAMERIAREFLPHSVSEYISPMIDAIISYLIEKEL